MPTAFNFSPRVQSIKVMEPRDYAMLNKSVLQPARMFSIVIPTFNAAKTLDAALGSLAIQTFRDFEVLIIDSASTDRTAVVAQAYVVRDARFKFQSAPDKGIYDAMNKGIRLAKGEWLYFLGSDDVLYSSTVLADVFATGIEGYDVVYGDVVSDRFNGRYDGEFSPEKILGRNICHQAIFFRKKLFAKTGNFNIRYRGYADWDHNMRWVLDKRIRKKYIDRIIATYADGGFSSLHSDKVFFNERIINYLTYAGSTISRSERMAMLKQEYERLLVPGSRKTLLRLFLKAPKIFLGV